MNNRRFNPTPNELFACNRVPFVASEEFDADEIAKFPRMVEKAEARHEAREDKRVAEAVAWVEKVRREGVDLGPGIVKGYAYRMGRASRRLGNR